MSTTQTSRPATSAAATMDAAPGGNRTTETRPRANSDVRLKVIPPGGDNDTRPTNVGPAPKVGTSGGDNSRQARSVPRPRTHAPAGEDSRPTKDDAPSIVDSSGGASLAGRQGSVDAQSQDAASDKPADRQAWIETQDSHAVGSGVARGPAASHAAAPMAGSLLDPALALAADMLDDIERVRIANENRLRQLTRSAEDSDGEMRGFGLDESHPDVARLAAMVAMMLCDSQVVTRLGLAKQPRSKRCCLEHDAERHLKAVLRRHPLHAWAKSMRGVGDKQVARLLAVIGDPYWRPEITRDDGSAIPAGPRTVSALWAYCGYHTTPVNGQTRVAGQIMDAVGGANFPAGQPCGDVQGALAGRDQLAARHPDQRESEGHLWLVWVAARRQRGQKANWSTKAKTRAYLIAESCTKQLRKPCAAGEHVEYCECSVYRLAYEQRKAATEGRLHAVACVRCGPAGKPAPPGTPWSDGHRHADALRIVAKEILKDLWREARRLHVAGQVSA